MSYLRLVAMILWSILWITLSLVVILFTFNRKLPLVMARKIWSPGILKILSSKTTVTGLENIEVGKSYVLMSNHLSYLDVPTLFKVIPLNIYFIAKKELRKTPFIGWYMRATDMIFIDRNDRNEAQKNLTEAAELIAKGKTVLIFPEGTLSPDGQIKRFKKGGFKLALEAGVEILPIAIDGTNEVWSSTSNTKFKPGSISVTIGKPISLADQNYNDLNELMKTVKVKVETLRHSK